MKRYAVLTTRFALVPTISGTFVISTNGRASGLEWAHTITGFATIYLILGLLLMAARHRQIRLQAAVALAVGLLEAIPGMPRLHAVVSPVLFASLAWAVSVLLSGPEPARGNSRWIFLLPAFIMVPILYGVGYRHKTSGFLPHIGAALLVAGLLLCFCMVMNERHPENTNLRRACNLTIAAVLFQVVFGIVAFIIRLLEIEGGLLLAYARTAHITGAALVLAASMELVVQYRRGVVGDRLIVPGPRHPSDRQIEYARPPE
jgi:heme A synthase